VAALIELTEKSNNNMKNTLSSFFAKIGKTEFITGLTCTKGLNFVNVFIYI
jgi:hypothetical protein